MECPLCEHARLQIYATAESGGRWYLCQHCRFRGDAIELYRAVYTLESLAEAVYVMVREDLLALESKTVSRATIAAYLTTYVEPRNRFQQLFDTATAQLAKLDAPTRKLMQEYKLWNGYKAGRWHGELGRFMGVLSAKQLHAEGYILPREFHRALVFPFYDVPGRISSFMLLGRHGRTRQISARHKRLEQDAGLMMADWLETSQPYVLALADPVMALRMQRKSFNAFGRPSPIVVYAKKTNKVWQTIHAGRVIFWEGDENYTMLKQAMMRVNSYVAARPKTDIAGSSYLADQNATTLLSTFRQSAVSWAEAMKRFILESDAWKVADYVHNLEIPEGLMQRIYDACTPVERQRVKQIIQETVPERFAYVGSARIAEVDGRWYTLYRDRRELASDAVLRIERAVNIKETNENLYEGVIVANGKELRFSEKIEVVEKKTAAWMQRLMMAAGMPPPLVDPKVEKHLVAIARKLHQPEYVQRRGRIGWNQELQSFIFPNFSIVDGRIDGSAHAAIQGDGVPAGKIVGYDPSEGDWDVLLNDADWAVIWAGLAGVMSNMLAPILGAPAQPLAFVGLPGSPGALVGEYLRHELNMTTAPVVKTKQPLLATRELNAIHGYPVWLDLAPYNRRGVAYIEAREPVNALTLVTAGEAAALGVGDAWSFVDGIGGLTQKERMPGLKGAFSYLAWLQRREFRLDAEATSLIRCVLESLKQWAAEELGSIDETTFSRASRMLRTYDMLSLDQRLLRLVFWLRQAQRIKLKESRFYDAFAKGTSPPDLRSPHLFVDGEKKKVYLSMAALRTAVFQARLAVPDYDGAIQALATTASGFEMSATGFVFDQDYYDREYTRWLRARG